MWVLKGIGLGLGMFVVGAIGTVVFLVFYAIRHPSKPGEGHATGLSVTLFNPTLWAVFAGCIVLGLAVVRFWPSARQ